MADDIFVIVGLILATLSIFYISLSKKQRDYLYERITLRRRRVSGSTTPPRSLTPDKKGGITTPVTTDYKEVFPPSRRGSLANVPIFSPEQKKKLKVAPPSPAQIKSAILPLMTPLEDCMSPVYTPTEFSAEEIRALGDFPDYAELSGVPLPEPYHDFDITKAKARPYRPLRWPYHQTMCSFSRLPSISYHITNPFATS